MLKEYLSNIWRMSACYSSQKRKVTGFNPVIKKKKKENSVQAFCIQNMNLIGNDHFYTTNAPQYLRAHPGQKEQGKELKEKGNQGTDTGKYHS